MRWVMLSLVLLVGCTSDLDPLPQLSEPDDSELDDGGAGENQTNGSGGAESSGGDCTCEPVEREFDVYEANCEGNSAVVRGVALHLGDREMGSIVAIVEDEILGRSYAGFERLAGGGVLFNGAGDIAAPCSAGASVTFWVPR
jgi:hypothetical protein